MEKDFWLHLEQLVEESPGWGVDREVSPRSWASFGLYLDD